MHTAVDQIGWFIESPGIKLESLDVDGSAAMWAARWAFDRSREHREATLVTESDWLAQGELWRNTIDVKILVSSVAPTEVEPA